MPWFLWLITIEPRTLMILSPGLALALWARIRVRKAWKRASGATELTGAEAAKVLLCQVDKPLETILLIDGPLTDQYDPWSHTIRLSRAVHEGRSIASLAISAHEAAFATLPRWSRLRSRLVIAIGLSGLTAWIVVAAGVLYRDTAMAEAGLALFSAVTIASLAVLPIETLANRSSLEAFKTVIPEDQHDAWAMALEAVSWRIVALPMTLRLPRI